jgi:NAD(P)-dependent dehydrogenase (short-subunit alcohol dehydrogenase family)
VNNAGIGLLNIYDEGRLLHDVDTEDFRQIIEVNVIGVFLCSKYAVPKMIEVSRGNVVNVSSGLGRRGSAWWGPYVTSKWALEGMTHTQAKELDEFGINVNALDPGGRVDTGFWDHLPDEERAGILDPDVNTTVQTLPDDEIQLGYTQWRLLTVGPQIPQSDDAAMRRADYENMLPDETTYEKNDAEQYRIIFATDYTREMTFVMYPFGSQNHRPLVFSR